MALLIFPSDEGPMLEMLDLAFYINSTPTFYILICTPAIFSTLPMLVTLCLFHYGKKKQPAAGWQKQENVSGRFQLSTYILPAVTWWQ